MLDFETRTFGFVFACARLGSSPFKVQGDDDTEAKAQLYNLKFNK